MNVVCEQLVAVARARFATATAVDDDENAKYVVFDFR